MACQGNTKVIIMIRHGQYENKGGPGYGRLTAKGREQATMAGKHLVARLRADPSLKRGLRSITSSAMDRAIETADLIEREIAEEVAWVDIDRAALPADLAVRFVSASAGDAEFVVVPGTAVAPIVVENPKNILQSRIEVQPGARLRISSPAAADASVETLGAALAGQSQVAVHHPLQPKLRPPVSIFGERDCSGCKKTCPEGDIHWSDDAEKSGVGFCDVCFAAGPKHKRLRPDDTLSRVTRGVPTPALRRPNDSNLNEADVDIASVLAPDDPLFPDFGVMNAQILQDHAQVEAAFRTHLHRCVNHKALGRNERKDALAISFVSSDSQEESIRHLTRKEFGSLELQEDGSCPWIWDKKVSEKVPGPFAIRRIGDEEVAGRTAADLRAIVAKAKLPPAAEKEVEVIVAHQNIIRYLFLRGMQFDTTMWLNLGGSNCTMTQLRINRRGDVICDFFADHGSMLPVSHYTFNNHPDV